MAMVRTVRFRLSNQTSFATELATIRGTHWETVVLSAQL